MRLGLHRIPRAKNQRNQSPLIRDDYPRNAKLPSGEIVKVFGPITPARIGEANKVTARPKSLGAGSAELPSKDILGLVIQEKRGSSTKPMT